MRKMSKIHRVLHTFGIYLPIISFAILYLNFTQPGKAMAQDDAKKEDKDETIEEKVADFETIDGLFQLYQDPESGKLFMEISEDQLGTEIIAFTYFENGVVDAGTFRGIYANQQILEPRRYFDRIEFVEKSTAFYFDPDSPLSRAKDANISPSIAASIPIAATTKGVDEDAPDRFLIEADDLFLSEILQQLKPSPNPDTPPNSFSIGDLSSSKTRYDDIRNYPENTDIIVDYVFDNKYPTNGGGDAVTDAHSITFKVRHSLIKLPDSNFEPRIADYRIGYFTDKVTDLTSKEAANYRDLVNKWRLVKKDPEAALSEPVKPITWWIENTTPLEYRDTIRDAVLAWNQSFEQAGFKNAVVVKVQPDDADWDAGDIRYNVLRWTSSPTPPFGGYGPSFSNPRTGELIGADIMLEYVFITNRLTQAEIFDLNAVGMHANDPFKNGIPKSPRTLLCSAGHELHLTNLFGQTALQAQGASEGELNQLVKESIHYLLLHEVGHTLGLNHNMKASIQWGPKEVHDRNVTKGAPTGSVMDYPAINMAPKGVTQGDYYMTRPGPYDDWAIEFAYKPNLDAQARNTLLSRAGEKGLAFGNDADDMRAPGRGIDPRVNINDMSSDPVAYAIDRIELAKSTLPTLVDKYNSKGSWQDLVNAYLITSGQHGAMATIISRQIGGVHVDRLSPEQYASEKTPYTPVSRDTQKRAMNALAKYVYAADAFTVSDQLAARLQPQRRGFDFGGTTEDPKIHQRVLNVQMGTLAHLLHPVVLERMVNSSLYGGNYSPTEMMLDLTNAIFGNDLKGNPNAFRKNLQIAYLERLVNISDSPEHSSTARSAALAALANIRSRFGFFDFNLSADSKAHRLQVSQIIKSVDL